jgi:hypothetical protein
MWVHHRTRWTQTSKPEWKTSLARQTRGDAPPAHSITFNDFARHLLNSAATVRATGNKSSSPSSNARPDVREVPNWRKSQCDVYKITTSNTQTLKLSARHSSIQ